MCFCGLFRHFKPIKNENTPHLQARLPKRGEDRMKKRNWLLLLAIIACLALYFGYQTMDRMNTDTTPPQITFSDDVVELSVTDPKDALLQGVSAADAQDGDVTASLVVERIKLTDPDGSILVKYAAFDRSGNVAKAEREAKYTDYESPRFSLSAPLLYTANSNFDVLDVISASDTLDGNIRHRIRATSLDNSAVTTTGSHEVEFRVSNTLGDTARLTLPVEVYAAGDYTMDVALTKYLIYLDAGTTFDAERYLDSVTRNREEYSLQGRMPDHFTVKITGQVNTHTPGVYAVDYFVTHTLVNEFNPESTQISHGWSRLIVVVEG